MIRHFVVDIDTRSLRGRIATLHQDPVPVRGMFIHGVRNDVQLGPTQGGRCRFKLKRVHFSPFALFNRGQASGVLQPINDYQTAVVLKIDFNVLWWMGIVQFVSALIFIVAWVQENSEMWWVGALFVPIAIISWAVWFLFHYWRMMSQLKRVFGETFAQVAHQPQSFDFPEKINMEGWRDKHDL